MKDDILLLEPASRQVQIGEKTYTLREMPAKRARKYFDALSELSTDVFDQESVEEAITAQAEKAREFVGLILGEEVDKTFMDEYMTSSMVLKLAEIQNNLNGLDDILKKTALRLAKEKD